MAMSQRAIRAFESVRPIDIFRVVGRRPSNVWVDPSGKVSPPGPGAQPLKELVYWRSSVEPGDQIQERVGGFFAVSADGACHPIALAPPTPLEPSTAFVHAQTIRDLDNLRLDRLVEEGVLVPVSGYKVSTQPTRPADRLVAGDHPLVIDQRPAELDDRPAPPSRGMGFRRSRG